MTHTTYELRIYHSDFDSWPIGWQCTLLNVPFFPADDLEQAREAIERHQRLMREGIGFAGLRVSGFTYEIVEVKTRTTKKVVETLRGNRFDPNAPQRRPPLLLTYEEAWRLEQGGKALLVLPPVDYLRRGDVPMGILWGDAADPSPYTNFSLYPMVVTKVERSSYYKVGADVLFEANHSAPPCSRYWECSSETGFGLGSYSDELSNSAGGRPWGECHCIREKVLGKGDGEDREIMLVWVDLIGGPWESEEV